MNAIQNLLLNMQAGLKPCDLSASEQRLLITHYGEKWFEHLGYTEPKYKKPEIPSELTILQRKSNEELQALAEEAESFWNSGLSPENSGLRLIIRERNMDEHVGELLHLSGEIFRECWLRGVGAKSND